MAGTRARLSLFAQGCPLVVRRGSARGKRRGPPHPAAGSRLAEPSSEPGTRGRCPEDIQAKGHVSSPVFEEAPGKAAGSRVRDERGGAESPAETPPCPPGGGLPPPFFLLIGGLANAAPPAVLNIQKHPRVNSPLFTV